MSDDGVYLVALSGLPDFQITVWNIRMFPNVEESISLTILLDLAKREVVITSVVELTEVSGITFNPMDHTQFVVFAPGCIRIMRIESLRNLVALGTKYVFR